MNAVGSWQVAVGRSLRFERILRLRFSASCGLRAKPQAVWLYCFLATAVCLLSAASAAAQDAVTAVPTALKQAYESSQTAKSEPEYTKVIELCQQGVANDASPTTTDYANRLMAWAHNRRGEAQDKAGQSDAALTDFETAVKLDGNNWRALHNRGVSYAIGGKIAEARADFDKVIQLQPNYPKVWYNRGELRAVSGDLPGAIEDYTAVLRLKSDDAPALVSRGNCYHLQRKYELAMNDFNRAVEIDPNQPLVYVQRAAVLGDLGRLMEQAADYRNAIRVDPKFGMTYQAASWLMATCPDERFRDKERAVLAAQKAIEIDGDKDFHYLDTLAAALASAGDFEQAQVTQAKALKAAPADDAKVVAELQARMKLYEQGRPYREQR